MESDGWKHNGENNLTKSFNMASRMPIPKVSGIKRRVVRDTVNGILLDDYWVSGSAKPSFLCQMNGNAANGGLDEQIQ